MHLKSLLAVVSIALSLGVQAAPNNSFDRGAGLKDLLKRSYSPGVDMSQISKRAMALVTKKRALLNRHRRASGPSKRCTVRPPQTIQDSPVPQLSQTSSSYTPDPSPAPAPEPTKDNNNTTNNNNNNNSNNGSSNGSSNNGNINVGSGSTAPNDLAQQWLDAHNSARNNHGASPLAWSDDLANAAKSWASGCKFKHSGGSLGPYGENLAAQTGGLTPAQAVQMWMDEVGDYNPSNPQPSHFSQVVWKGTTQLGCAIVSCGAGTIFSAEFGSSDYAVCEYNPPGNVIGQFAENVQK